MANFIVTFLRHLWKKATLSNVSENLTENSICDNFANSGKNVEEVTEGDDGGPEWAATRDLCLAAIKDPRLKKARAQQRAMLLGIDRYDNVDDDLFDQLDAIKKMLDSRVSYNVL